MWVVGPVQDTQCGFKGFTRRAAHDVFARQQVTSIVFDVELDLPRPAARLPARGRARSAGPTAAGRACAPGRGLAARVAWDLFRIPLIHRDVERARAGRGSHDQAARLTGASAADVAIETRAAAWPDRCRVRDRAFVRAVVRRTLAVAGDTLGFDFLAYHAAAARVLDGQPLYDTSFQAAGGFGLFYYPPTFAPLILPFGLLPATTAVVGLDRRCCSWRSSSGVAILPGADDACAGRSSCSPGCRGRSLYAIKLGQVGPLLFLLFAIGWRWLDDPAVLGASAALGAAIKLQPGLHLRVGAADAGAGWRSLSGRARAGGSAPWPRRSWRARRPGRTSSRSSAGSPTRSRREHNFTPGAVAFQLGVPRELASVLQVVASTVAGRRAGRLRPRARAEPAPSYLVAVVASSSLSPILWDHYAMLLLLPVAWLLERRQWWAAAVPLVDGGRTRRDDARPSCIRCCS